MNRKCFPSRIMSTDRNFQNFKPFYEKTKWRMLISSTPRTFSGWRLRWMYNRRLCAPVSGSWRTVSLKFYDAETQRARALSKFCRVRPRERADVEVKCIIPHGNSFPFSVRYLLPRWSSLLATVLQWCFLHIRWESTASLKREPVQKTDFFVLFSGIQGFGSNMA